MADMIQQEFGSTYRRLSIAYSVEDEPLGTGGALMRAMAQTDCNLCLAMNGDSYLAMDFAAFLKWHYLNQFAGSVVVTRVEDAAHFGTVEVNSDGTLRAFAEKQGRHIPGWINAGIYLLTRTLLESVSSDKAVSIERECFPQWVIHGLGAYRTEAAFIDIGTPESYAQAEHLLSSLGRHDTTEQELS
jgi:D-glycero-alpha-D-manno-heptose 1-phosphate guanylyltransferase